VSGGVVHVEVDFDVNVNLNLNTVRVVHNGLETTRGIVFTFRFMSRSTST